MHSAILTSTPKKIMLGEAREKKLIVQQVKEAWEIGKLEKPAGKDILKHKRQQEMKHCKRERKHARERSFWEVLWKTREHQWLFGRGLGNDDGRVGTAAADDEYDDSAPGSLNKDICILSGDHG